MALTDAQIAAQRAFGVAAFGSEKSANAAIDRLKARRERMGNLQRAMDGLAATFQAETALAFVQRRSPAGQPWPPLAASTIAARAGKTGRGGLLRSRSSGRFTSAASMQPLVRTRLLIDSIKYSANGGGIAVKFGAFYMQIHQSGASNGRPPKRNMLVIERVGGRPVLYPDADKRFRAVVNAFVLSGATL